MHCIVASQCVARYMLRMLLICCTMYKKSATSRTDGVRAYHYIRHDIVHPYHSLMGAAAAVTDDHHISVILSSVNTTTFTQSTGAVRIWGPVNQNTSGRRRAAVWYSGTTSYVVLLHRADVLPPCLGSRTCCDSGQRWHHAAKNRTDVSKAAAAGCSDWLCNAVLPAA